MSDKDSFELTGRLAREYGLLVGGSCGRAVVAALEVARRAGPDDVVVVLLPDNGRGYLSKIFNDSWMARYGWTLWGMIQDGTSAIEFDFWQWSMAKLEPAEQLAAGPRFDELLTRAAAR